MNSVEWRTDLLGPDFQACEIPLGTDPDGEGEITATLIRHSPAAGPSAAGHSASDHEQTQAAPAPHAVLYLHGFTDYFFQSHVAEHFAAQGFEFYALDLRKCGRSLRPGLTPHFVRDLAAYDAEIEAALEIIRAGRTGAADAPSPRILLVGHSTGGLILPLWLDRLRRAADPATDPAAEGADRPAATAGQPRAARLHRSISGLVLNSPWFDLQGKPHLRSVGTLAIDALGRLRPSAPVPAELSDVYGTALHKSHGGEWSYDLDWKPLTGFPVLAGWLRAVRIGHAQLHKGLDVGVPSLVLRSARTVFTTRPSEATTAADTVLDVRQIARWSGCLGGQNTIVPIDDALHDVFLSAPPVRARAFAVLDRWIEAVGIRRSTALGADTSTAARTDTDAAANTRPRPDTDPRPDSDPHNDKETAR